MYRNNSSVPPHMRFPPPPFLPPPPNMDPNIVRWRPPPPIVPSYPPPWPNSVNAPIEVPHQFPMARPPVRIDFTPASGIIKEKSQEERDKQWVNDFLHRRSGIKPIKPPIVTEKIPYVKQLHSRAYKLIQQLHNYATCSQQSGEDWQLSETKKELDKILALFNDEKYITGVRTSLLRQTKKRARLKKRKREMFKKHLELQNRATEKHLEIDKWLEDRKKAEDDLKRERKVRKDLDEYLSGVRQKQQNAKKRLELFNALAKLRKARSESAIRKGHSPPSKSLNEVFRTTHRSTCEKIKEFISSCKNEENFMRKYLTEEQEAEEKRIEEQLAKEEERKVINWKNRRSEVLFGPEGEVKTSDSLWHAHKLHIQGTRDIVGLISVRSQWDLYMSEGGSRIPSKWVEPTSPSSDGWSKYLEKS